MRAPFGSVLSDAATWLSHPPERFNDLRNFLHDKFAAFEHWLTSLTVLEWVLFALALALVLWVVAKVRAATTLGPIEVAPIEPASGDAALHALTAELRRRIDEVGLRPPPDVPGGAPEANLLTAIEKSPIPQANWIAALLQVLPRPRPVTYKLVTTQLAGGAGIAFSLRPSGSGAAIFGTAIGDDTAALRGVARRVLMHVSKDADDIFPSWTRWDDEPALTAYLNGMDAAKEAQYNTARESFEVAIDSQPDNAVARLRRLNALEAQARAIPQPDEGLATTEQAKLLRSYLSLVVQRPELIEARYRTSTLAANLAGQYDAGAGETVLVPGELGLTVRQLREVAALTLEQALAQLQPWFVPLTWHRARYAIEPRGGERRRLRRTLVISTHCRFLREHAEDDDSLTALRRRRRAWVVRWRADRRGTGWQEHYNAGCFFALLGDIDEAYRYLNRALDGGGYDTLVDWMRDDPDLALLHADIGWDPLIHRDDVAHRRVAASDRRAVQWSLGMAFGGLAGVIALLTVPWAWAVAVVLAVLHVGVVQWRYLANERRLLELGAMPTG